MSRLLGLKKPKLTARQEREAYAAATVRDSVNGVERCQRCGRYGACDRDHRQNRDPFNTVPSNLQLLGSSEALGGCGCHRYKTENPMKALQAGFSVPSWGDPLDWPAWRHGVGWVLYLDEPDERGSWWRSITREHAERLLTEFGVLAPR